ncbi:hypothetical protein [Streptomyces sp. NRRL S-31]|uniref:hypothetical protein n=1 Tax=Streptomyces sp. NRRL S-31 TaxID=1463898 RepID=UPI0004C4E52B|nr:hypothetical protein [Streptomyces sp. NRRL S-31]
MDTDTDPAFLRSMDAQGLLLVIDGRRCVAGTSTDDLTGTTRLLVEHADADLLSGTRAPVLWRTLLDRFPDTSEVLLRVEAETRLPDPWQRYSSYLVLDDTTGAEAAPPDGPPFPVRAESRHRDRVAGWVADALRAADDVQGRPHDVRNTAEAARRLLDSPSCVSFVVEAAGAPVGHATLLSDAHDDTTGRDFVELFDVLVEDVPGASHHRGALVAAAVSYAREAGRPLLGNVTHGRDRRAGAVGGDVGAPVVDLLRGRGWRVDHVYWTAPTTRLAEAVRA